MKLTAALRFALILIGLVAASQANAVCSSPAGIAGDIAYSSNINAPVYCDGTTWTSMSGGSGSGGGTANPAGTTNDVQFNSAGSLAADTGLFTYAAGLLRAPTISATTLNGQYASLTTIFNAGSFSGNTIAVNSVSSTLVSATYISGTLIQAGTGAGAFCDAARKGSIRYSNTSNTLEYCNSTAWVSAGSSDTAVPAFSVSRGGTNQTVTVGTNTKIQFTAERFDTNNNFDNATTYRFTPTIPGKYSINLNAGLVAVAGNDYVIPAIFRNGVQYSSAVAIATAGGQSLVATTSAIIDMNGTTDYIEFFTQQSIATLSGVTHFTHASGALITMAGGGSGGGTATPAGTTNDVQFNSAGALAADTGKFTYTNGTLNISGSLAGYVFKDRSTGTGSSQWYRTGNRTHLYDSDSLSARLTLDNLTGNIGIGDASPIARLDVSGSISTSSVIQVSGTSLACTTALKGSIRYSNTSNTLEYCNSTAWVSAGPSDTSVPAFRVHKNGTNQSVSAGVAAILTWSTEQFDSNNNFASDRFTPTIPGKYLIDLNVHCSVANSYCDAMIRKNGAVYSSTRANSNTSYNSNSRATAIIDMNGTTDYIDAQVNTGATSIYGASDYTSFSGILITMNGGGSGGGTATPAGISGSIQFNSAGALAGRSDIIVDPSGSVGIGTGAPKAALDVSGTVRMAGTGAEACVSNTLGTFRFNPVTGVPQICR